MAGPPERPDSLISRLAAVDAEVTRADDSTVMQLRQELEAMVRALREPAGSASFETEPACRAATEIVQELGAAASPVSAGRLGQYELLAKLGEGGMGAVYKARHAKLDKIVALKILPPQRIKDTSAVARFEREMRAVGKLDHPNIVRAMDAGEVDGMHYLVMEYVDGIDLGQLVKQRGPLPIAEACELVRQAAIGLDEAHASGMVHRDIKPSNLMLCRTSAIRNPQSAMVKILDLGLALLSEAHTADAQGLTSSGQLMGTIDYMAPEQGGDSHVVDVRADIYSLGATLYKLLTGEAIYQGAHFQTPVQKLMALANQPAPPIQSRRAGIPNELAKIVHRMLEKSPSNRYATPKEVADALAPFSAGADLAALMDRSHHAPHEEYRLAQPQDVDDHTTPVKRRSPLMLALVAFGGIAAVLAGIILFWRTPQGTVRIEINDPSITAQVDAKGVDIKQGDNQPIRVESGEHGLRIKHRELEFETDKFILKKGEDVTLKIEVLPGQIQVIKGGESFFLRAIPPELVKVDGGSPENERSIAEWVLDHGGSVSILLDDANSTQIQSIDQLPMAPVRVAAISVTSAAFDDRMLDSCHTLAHLQGLDLNNVSATEAGLARFLDSPAATKLQSIRLAGWKLTSKSLSQLRRLPITHLFISNCELERNATGAIEAKKLVSVMLAWSPGVDDEALVFLKGSTTIEQIDLGGTAVSDQGLENLIANAGLVNLDLRETSVTEAGLQHVLRFPKLGTLSLHSLPIADGGLARLKALTELKSLNVTLTKVTDAGLAELATMKLEDICLNGLPITDQGLEHLQKATTLIVIDVKQTKVTSDGVKQLATALPGCTIEWDGGKIEPKMPTNTNRSP